MSDRTDDLIADLVSESSVFDHHQNRKQTGRCTECHLRYPCDQAHARELMRLAAAALEAANRDIDDLIEVLNEWRATADMNPVTREGLRDR